MAKPSKCEIGKESLEYLGHDYMKVVNVTEIKQPTTKKEFRSFLGILGYYRRYILDYATIAVPLTNLTKKNSPNEVIWRPIQQEAFDKIKYSLTEEPILKLVDFNKPFILRTDVSNTGLGSVLLQEHDGDKGPTALVSKKLSTAEQKYSVVERECLGIVWAMKFYKFLYGQEFILETDHQPVTYLKSAKIMNGRFMRWALYLQEFKISFQYLKGSENVGADYLSRSG